MFQINFAAVLVAAVANFVIGFLLHGPVLGKLWMKLANVHPTGKEKFSDMAPQLVKNLLANILFATALALVYLFASTSPALSGPGVKTELTVVGLVWLGFILAGSSMEVIWMGKSFKLWCFELFSSLVCTIAMVAIIGAW